MCYIGAGKGKTTAAMGVAVRAAGYGMDVYILQFVKADPATPTADISAGEWPLSNEINFFNRIATPPPLGKIYTEQVGKGFVGILGDQKDKDIHIAAAKMGLQKAESLIQSGQYQLIILDELISALELNLITEQDIVGLIHKKPPTLHVILTGHNKYDTIIEACDLVTEMKMIKHPYYSGVLAQEGIDY